MKRKNILCTAILIGIFVFNACATKDTDKQLENQGTQGVGNPSSYSNQQSEELKSLISTPAESEMSGWKISILDCMIGEKLNNINVVLGYAAAETNEFEKIAEEGKEFCILKMKFEKGKSLDVIDWDELELIDADGNRSHRMEDSFVEDLGLQRMSGTVLNFGSNEGWMVFEIKKGARDLVLEYPFTEDLFQEKLKLEME